MDSLKMLKCLIEMLTTQERGSLVFSLVHLVFSLTQCVSEVPTPAGSCLIVPTGGPRPAVFNGIG
jgi:hypothetical protein